MTPHLRLKGPVFCQTLYQHTLLSRVSVRLLSSAMSKYEELFIHGADLKTIFIFSIFSLNWPILKLSNDITFLYFM